MKSLDIFCLLPAIALLSFGQATPEVSVEQTLMQLERDWTQASLKKDVDTLNKIMADDWVNIDFQGKVVTKAQTIANLKTGLPATQAAGLGEMKVRVFGDAGAMPDVSDLPPAERARRYHRLAQDAVREAERTTGAIRESYLIFAEQFRLLAMATEADIRAGR